MTLVYMFPGQSSRYPGMLQKLARLHPANQALLASSSEILGRDLGAHYREDNEDVFATNTDVQIGVFLANHMFLQILESEGFNADLSLGLSLGEYNHLVHINALSWEDGLRAVQRRGEAYDNGPRGAMASVFPIDLEELQEVARRASVDTDKVLEVVNLNSPRQHVLSGESEALERAMAILDDEFFARAVVIEQQVPMHCSIFEPAGHQFRTTLEDLSFAEPRLPYFPNRLGRIHGGPLTPADFVELLSTHVYHPVLWRHSIDHIVEHFPDPVFVEVGPLSVLHNLINRKWHKVPRHHTDSTKDTAEHLQGLFAALRGGEGGVQGGEGK